LFKLGLQVCCGRGDNVNFWTNQWNISEHPFAQAFLSLFEITTEAEATILSQRSTTDLGPAFRCILSPLRLFALGQLQTLLQSSSFSEEADFIHYQLYVLNSSTRRPQDKVIISILVLSL